MSLNYKSAAIKAISVPEVLIKNNSDDGFTEVKKGKKNNQINQNNKSQNNQVNIISQSTSSTYDKEYINEIINDTFELEYSGNMIEAKIDFEDIVENEFYLKFKYPINPKSKSLHDIIKYHSANYYKIKQDVHKNKSKYL